MEPNACGQGPDTRCGLGYHARQKTNKNGTKCLTEGVDLVTEPDQKTCWNQAPVDKGLLMAYSTTVRDYMGGCSLLAGLHGGCFLTVGLQV